MTKPTKLAKGSAALDRADRETYAALNAAEDALTELEERLARREVTSR